MTKIISFKFIYIFDIQINIINWKLVVMMEVIKDNPMVAAMDSQVQIFIAKLKDIRMDLITILMEVKNNPNSKAHLQQGYLEDIKEAHGEDRDAHYDVLQRLHDDNDHRDALHDDLFFQKLPHK